MKKLQSNFTTPEQSKRLLELGVPADSADMVQVQDEITTDEYILVLNNDNDNGLLFEQNPICVPIWSVGRLIEIATILNNGVLYIRNDFEGSLVETLIKHLLEYNDFSKLEE